MDNHAKSLEYITQIYRLDLNLHSPIEIPNMGRDKLAELFKELDFKAGVEVGTEAGVYAEIICKANPQAKLYCVDPWKIYPEYRDIVKQELMEQVFSEAKKRLSSYNCELIADFSANAVKRFDDNSLDFVYLDGNHEYPYITFDLIEWSKKVRPGGIIAGHDYVTSNQPIPRNQVFPAVNGYMAAYKIAPWFVLGTKAIVPGEIRDRPRSWMRIK